jgi:hypothetical protein
MQMMRMMIQGTEEDDQGTMKMIKELMTDRTNYQVEDRIQKRIQELN